MPIVLFIFVEGQVQGLSSSLFNIFSTVFSHPLLYSTLHYTALHYSTLHCSPLLYTTLHCSTLLYNTLLYSTLLYTTLLYSPLHYTTLPYPTLFYSTLLYSTLLYSTLCLDDAVFLLLFYTVLYCSHHRSVVLFSIAFSRHEVDRNWVKKQQCAVWTTRGSIWRARYELFGMTYSVFFDLRCTLSRSQRNSDSRECVEVYLTNIEW